MSTASSNTDPKPEGNEPQEEQFIEVKPETDEPQESDFEVDADDGKEFDFDIPAAIDSAPEKPKEAPPATPPAPATTPTPAAPTAPVTPEAPPAVPAAPPVAPVAPAAPPSGTPAPAPQPTPAPTPQLTEAETQDIAAARDKFISDLAPTFQLTPEQADELITDPNKVLPRVAAQVVATTYEAVMRTIGAQLPMMLETYNHGARLRDQVVDEFYDKFPDLKGHEAVVEQTAKAFRAVNPGATKEQAMQMVGSMVMVQLGLHAPSAPAAPTPTPAPAPVTIPPHVAAHGAPGANSGQPSRVNLFEHLALGEFEDM